MPDRITGIPQVAPRYCPWALEIQCGDWCRMYDAELGCMLVLPQAVQLVYAERQAEALELQALTTWARQQGHEDLIVTRALVAAAALARRISTRVIEEEES